MREVGICPETGRAHRGIKGERRYGFAGVRRIDSAVDLMFPNRLEGLAALAGVAAVPLPRVKTKIIREAGGRRIETVAFQGYSGKNTLGRWYDKSVETGSGLRGSWVRSEDQRRFDAKARVPVELVTETNFVRDTFRRRFEPLWRASKGVKVGSSLQLAARLGELVEAGEITARQARTIAGHLVLEAGGLEEAVAPVSSRYRYKAQARNHGLVLADGVLDEVEIDLGEVLETAMDEGAWGVG
jgi:hypothetical protein